MVQYIRDRLDMVQYIRDRLDMTTTRSFRYDYNLSFQFYRLILLHDHFIWLHDRLDLII